jgi:hypothetical protein
LKPAFNDQHDTAIHDALTENCSLLCRNALLQSFNTFCFKRDHRSHPNAKVLTFTRLPTVCKEGAGALAQPGLVKPKYAPIPHDYAQV